MKELITSPFFFSVIFVYNVVLYLKECLDSILAIIFSDGECICLDTELNEGILERLSALGMEVPTLKAFNDHASSIYNAMNQAVKMVQRMSRD